MAIAPTIGQAATDPLCDPPVLERLTTHKVAAAENLDSIAQQYKLIPATIMGLNPSTRSGQVKVGETLLIPPYNGIRVEVPAGTGLKAVAAQYKVRADLLFEMNGCQPAPRVVFVPGVNWSPVVGSSGNPPPAAAALDRGYPLKTRGNTLMGYGWKIKTEGAKVALHSGLDLAAAPDSDVLAAAAGTIAFAGAQGSYGQLVVINHAQGYQTRYAQLGKIQAKVGQTVSKGEVIGTVGQSGKPSSSESHLHFEVRSNSKLGWVAQDPNNFLK
jgi:murein DD-endopeptidase MepM/ murein hydrolase activator NlpD